MKVKLTVVPFILASTVQAWSAKTITVDTTSGHLSGTQAGGGAQTRYLLLTKNDLLYQWYHLKAL